MLVPNNLPPFEWAYQHMALVGWPTVCYCAWRLSRYVDRVTRQAVKTVSQIDKMATNCFPTMQRSLENQDGLLHSMDKSLKTIAENSSRREQF
jgi:hypothetical protein